MLRMHLVASPMLCLPGSLAGVIQAFRGATAATSGMLLADSSLHLADILYKSYIHICIHTSVAQTRRNGCEPRSCSCLLSFAQSTMRDPPWRSHATQQYGTIATSADVVCIRIPLLYAMLLCSCLANCRTAYCKPWFANRSHAVCNSTHWLNICLFMPHLAYAFDASFIAAWRLLFGCRWASGRACAP